MPKLSFGTRTHARWEIPELLQRVGDISQFAGVRIGELGDGFERGVRQANFRTGTGFEFSVLVDRGLDIAWATFNGASISWRSSTTATAPAYYDPMGMDWLRSFHGGLLNTCGLTSMGMPSEDEGQSLGLHGRASNIPASHFSYGGEWDGDEYEMWVSGQLREAIVFGENITFEVKPKNELAATGLEHHRRFQPPTPGYEEQVFFHTLKADAQGFAQAALVNRAFQNGQGLGGYVRFQINQLPRLVQWKMMGQTEYVCGLEPSTNWVGGRAAERAAGRLQYLEPGESRKYNLEIGVLASQAEIDAFARNVSGE